MELTRKASTWKEALAHLKEGNERFVGGLRSAEGLMGHLKLSELARLGQKPFATILTCSDSRVPAELVFDQGLGDLFVIRVAGNVVQPTQIASIEYAVAVLEVPLVVVMGHTKCGAVQAALDAEANQTRPASESLAALIDLIRPAIRKVLSKPGSKGKDTALALGECVEENVGFTAADILEKSPLLKDNVSADQIGVVQAVFDLDTGLVKYLKENS